MPKLAGRPWSPAGAPFTFWRSKSTTALPTLSETAEADLRHVEVVEKRTQLQVTTIRPLPEHHEAHAGPYGVEMPTDFSFVATVTEVTIDVKSGEEANGLDKSTPEGSSAENRKL